MNRAMLFAMACSLTASPVMAANIPDEATPEQLAANAAAEERGRQVYAHDRAAWHGSAALGKLVDLAEHPEVRGYLTTPNEDGTIDLIFYSEVGEALYEFARFVMNGSVVQSGGILEDSTETLLSDVLLQQAQARSAALNFAAAQAAQMCGQASANTVVLPKTEEGTLPVYILSAPTRPGRYPIGGHYLVEIDDQYQPASGRAFSNECLDGPIMPANPDIGPGIFYVTHALDNHPTEIHYFAHLHMKVPLGIVAQNTIWTIDLFDGDLDVPEAE